MKGKIIDVLKNISTVLILVGAVAAYIIAAEVYEYLAINVWANG